MKPVTKICGILALCVIFVACKNVDFKKTKTGVPYKIVSGGNTKDTIGLGSIVKFQKILKVKDSVLMNTYTSFPVYQPVQAASTSYADPLAEILMGAKKGDSIYYTQSMDSFIAHNPQILAQTPFRKGDQLVTTIKIVDVFKTSDEAQADYMNTIKQAGVKEEKSLEDYLSKKNIKAEKTAGGVYIHRITPGQGPKPDSGKFVTVNYVGTDLDGKIFDQGTYPFQLGMHGAIPGFEEAVKNMQKGEKAQVFIPSLQGYGPQGSPPAIKPNATLVFNLELVDISDKAPAQNQMPPNIDTTAIKQK